VAVDLRQLRYFVAVAEAGSLTRAAGRLHIAQQSLSEQIRALEAQFGAPLFERSSRGVRLTDVGTVLLREARPLLAQAERTLETTRRAARGEGGTLRVGFLSSVANYVLPPVVRAFRERHPEVTLHVEDVLIAALPVRRGCDKPEFVVDRFDVFRDGATALSFDEGGIRVETVNGARGTRPWSKPLPTD